MTRDGKDEITGLLRTALRGRSIAPTPEFRRLAWEAFEHALDAHLQARRAAVRRLKTQR